MNYWKKVRGKVMSETRVEIEEHGVTRVKQMLRRECNCYNINLFWNDKTAIEDGWRGYTN